MASNVKTKSSVTVYRSHGKAANIVAIVVGGIAVLVLVAIAVMCAVKVDPMDAFKEPATYYFYNLSSTDPEGASDSASHSKIKGAVSDMKFSVMSAFLQWSFDYSYNFTYEDYETKNDDGEKITATRKKETTSSELRDISATADKYMIELVYDTVLPEGDTLDLSKAQTMTVDGETVYFDRVKILIGNSEGSVGVIEMYPYLYARLNNQSDIDGIASDVYTVTAVTVRADTTRAFIALGDLAKELGSAATEVTE